MHFIIKPYLNIHECKPFNQTLAIVILYGEIVVTLLKINLLNHMLQNCLLTFQQAILAYRIMKSIRKIKSNYLKHILVVHGNNLRCIKKITLF